MADAKHTPGPWVWWDVATGRPPKYDLMRLMGMGQRAILGCYGGAGFRALGKTEEDIANAHLIGACPEMFDALERIANGSSDEMARIVARAAIAKATGSASHG